MSSIDNRKFSHLSHGNHIPLHDGNHLISLDAVRARTQGGDEGNTASPPNALLPTAQKSASGFAPARSADVVHLNVSSGCRAGSGNRERSASSSSASSSPINSELSGAMQSSSGPSGSTPAHSGLPDLAMIAREPDYARRRSELVHAMAFFSGSTVSERVVDHQMIISGLAAGHGSTGDGSADDAPWPLGSSMDDPAVVVGLVLHHVRHIGGRDVPVPRFVMRQLNRHAGLGSPAARLVRDWLGKRSIGNDRQPSHNSLHLQVHDGGKP